MLRGSQKRMWATSKVQDIFPNMGVVPPGHVRTAQGLFSGAILADSPLAYWKMDEASGNLTDASGNAHTATASGSGLTYAQGSPLTDGSGNSILFNGTSGYFDTYDPDIFLTAGTIMFLAKPWDSTQNGRIWGQQNGFPGVGFSVACYTGKWYLEWEGPSGSYKSLTSTASYSLANYALIHVTFEKTPDANVRLFIDGVEAAGSPVGETNTMRNEARNAAIGRAAGNVGSNYYKGYLSNLAIFAGKLSSTRIAAHQAAR